MVNVGNSGFTSNLPDNIFGPYTERAVREFQSNSGLHADGIAGDDTFAAVRALHHVWQDREPRAHSGARTQPARASCPTTVENRLLGIAR